MNPQVPSGLRLNGDGSGVGVGVLFTHGISIIVDESSAGGLNDLRGARARGRCGSRAFTSAGLAVANPAITRTSPAPVIFVRNPLERLSIFLVYWLFCRKTIPLRVEGGGFWHKKTQERYITSQRLSSNSHRSHRTSGSYLRYHTVHWLYNPSQGKFLLDSFRFRNVL